MLLAYKRSPKRDIRCFRSARGQHHRRSVDPVRRRELCASYLPELAWRSAAKKFEPGRSSCVQRGEGLELQEVPIEGFNPNPAILDNVTDPIYKGWVSIVNSYWTLLIRQVCLSTISPLKHYTERHLTNT